MSNQNWFHRWGVFIVVVVLGVGLGLVGTWGALNLSWGNDFQLFSRVCIAVVGVVTACICLYAAWQKYSTTELLFLIILFLVSSFLGSIIGLVPIFLA